MNSETRLEIQVAEPGSDRAVDWDAFVSRNLVVHLEQTTYWGDARRVDGWRPELLMLREDGRLVAGAMVLTRSIGRRWRVGYVSRGPMVGASDALQPADLLAIVIRELQRFARRSSLVCLILDPPYFSQSLAPVLTRAGFTPHLKALPPQGLSKGALILDLRPDEVQLRAGMRRLHRRLLRRAEQSPLVARRGGRDDLKVLWELMQQLCRRRGVTPNVSRFAFLERLWDRLAPGGHVRMDVVESEGQPIAALMTVCLGKWGIPWRIGWSGSHPRLSPETLLYWNTIRALKCSGAEVFDLNWVDPDAAASVAASGDDSGGAVEGITLYKMGFGGEMIRLVPPLDYFPNPLIRQAIRWGLGGVLNSPWLGRAVHGLTRRSL